MATRSDLRGLLKQSQKNSSADARSPSYLNSADAQTKERGSHSRKESDDEVVKYMSKLPAYLQGDDESNVVLNVGVLDWSRLEKWKHGRAKGAERNVSSTTTLGTLPNASSSHHMCKIDACSNLRKVKAVSRDLHHSVHGVRCTSVPELTSSSSRDSLNKQKLTTCSFYKSSARDHERVKNPDKSRRLLSRRELASSGLLSDMGNSGGSLGANGSFVVRDKETEKRAGEVHAQEAEERATESFLKQCTEKLDGEEKIVRVSDAGLTCENHQVSSNIVLLRSRKQSRSTLSSEPHMSSLDDKANVAREVNRSLDFTSSGLTSQVPRSCSVSIDLEIDSEDMKLPLLGVDKKERSGGTTRHSKTASRMFDQEIRQLKNIEPSPSKRFSFSFGRLSRSFTFKEDSSSAAQPLTSSSDDTIKSDSMRFDGSACPYQSSNPEKQNNHGGSRVSPLRRLLDPLLKPKGSENFLPSEARSSSFNQDEMKKQDASRTRALLQLTIRNGIPLFQFVVDDESRRSILGATMKSSDSSFKDDSVKYCTFYSVNEVKKKRKGGSWLIHGHKDKQQQRFVYNVIGEMRLCNSSMNADNISSVIRESVVVDESEQVVKGRIEVAAVVIKKKLVKEALGETTVILPGGDHSIPEKGAPTPLISRWRSGGCCDCGGWDVGCKLHVLSNKTSLHDLEDQSFKLFAQEEESDKNSGPVLAMTELKTGIYRVEFGSFLSHLQAFFVCVTVITCASEEETVSKTDGKSSSPFAPPLSPVGRA